MSDEHVPYYQIIIEHGEHNVSAYCPDLPGCVATGKDDAECCLNMSDAIAFHLDGLKEDKDFEGV